MKNKKPALILVVTALSALLATFNETFLNIALTPIMNDLSVSVSTVQWLTTGYMLAAAIMVPISSFLYRKIKTKPLFLVTVLIVLIGTIIGASAQSFSVLLIGRIIQAIGTGMLIPIGMNTTLSVIPKEKLGTYMGILGAMTTLGPSLSIIGAGIILNVGSWHTLFIFFAIMIVILFLLGLIILGEDKKESKEKLDFASVTYVSLALIGILYGMSTIFSGSLLFAVLALVIGILFLVLFVRRQNKIENPFINLEPLRIKPFRTAIILNMLAILIVFALNIIMPLYIQSALGVSAFNASLILFPAIILSCLVATIAGKIYDKSGAKVLLPLGFILMCAFAIVLGLTRDLNNQILIALLYIPIICGSALIIGPVQSFGLSHLNRELNTHGVTLFSTGFQIAGCIGSSLFTGVYSYVLGMNSGLSIYESTSNAFLVAILVAALISFISFVIALSVRKMENVSKPVTQDLEAIMKKDVFTVKENDTLLDVLKYITDKGISGAPVVNSKGTLTGFISDGDIMRYLSKVHPLFINAYSLAYLSEDNFDEKLNSLMKSKVKDIVKKKAITIDVNTDIESVCKILTDKHLKKAPVVKDGKMVGIVNRSNITKYAIDSYLKKVEA